MNVETMTMPRAEARAKIAACRKLLKRRADEEALAALKAYEQVEKGAVLLNVRDAILRCGFDAATGYPKLAIARADRKRVTFRRDRGRINFDASTNQYGAQGDTLQVRFDTPPPMDLKEPWRTPVALVPMVPADALETAGWPRLSKCFVLWEVEKWEPVAPRDPYLLRHVHGDLYAVLAAWDLTELERSIMAGRARS